MYFFGFGGDIPRFFMRYRERLGERADIPHVSGLSQGDLAQLEALYGPNGGRGASGAVEVLSPRALDRVRALVAITASPLPIGY
jgi:hypothetical protein